MTPANFPTRALESAFAITDTGASGVLAPDKQFGITRLISAGVETRTAPAPLKAGLRWGINGVTLVGAVTITFATAYDETGTTTMEFNATGQFVDLISVEQGSGTYVWRVVGYDGVTGPVVTLGAGAFDSIVGTDSSLGITGLASTTGGAVVVTGGTSSTSGTAGGAVTATGGTPGATGVGGAVTLTGAAGGATSGTGGAISLTGGAGTGVTTTGGAASVGGGIGGTGTTTNAGGVGGATTITSGAGGAKTGTGAAAGGAAGALSITGGVGGATASSGTDAGGVGSTVAITGGAGGAASAGTGNGGAGGSITLTPGAGGTSAGGTAGARGTVTATGFMAKSASAAAITTTRALTAADSGGIFTVAKSAAYAITLPTPQQGLMFKFLVLDTGANIVTISDGSAHLLGTVSVNNTNTAMTGTTISLASGGSVGDWVQFEGISATQYLVTGACIAAADITVA